MTVRCQRCCHRRHPIMALPVERPRCRRDGTSGAVGAQPTDAARYPPEQCRSRASGTACPAIRPPAAPSSASRLADRDAAHAPPADGVVAARRRPGDDPAAAESRYRPWRPRRDAGPASRPWSTVWPTTDGRSGATPPFPARIRRTHVKGFRPDVAHKEKRRPDTAETGAIRRPDRRRPRPAPDQPAGLAASGLVRVHPRTSARGFTKNAAFGASDVRDWRRTGDGPRG